MKITEFNLITDPRKLSSIAPAYVKVGDEVRRLQYSAFCVEAVSGTTPKSAREKVLVTFYPKETGHYTQCWTLTYWLTTLRALKHKRRVVFEGTATSRPAINAVPVIQPRPKDRVFLKTSTLDFTSSLNVRQSLSFKLGNPLKMASKVVLHSVQPPFYLKYREVLVEAGHSARIPVRFKPEQAGSFRDTIVIDTEQGALALVLNGVCTLGA